MRGHFAWLLVAAGCAASGCGGESEGSPSGTGATGGGGTTTGGGGTGGGASTSSGTSTGGGGGAGTGGGAGGTGGGGGAGGSGGGVCGDGVLDPGEACDDGNADDADGCTQACAFTCASPADCDDGDPCTADSCDAAAHTCSSAPDVTQDGQPCMVGALAGLCAGGACVACGDGAVGPGEECDNGAANGAGTGCEASCVYSCHAAGDCLDAEPCNGDESCAAIPAGQQCAPGTALADGTSCGAQNEYCSAGVCTVPSCGNSIVEPGEGCEPPGTASCDAACQIVVCGDGVLAGTEQCDDGDLENLDGCDSGCRYETVMRATLLAMVKGAPPAFCTYQANAFGTALAQNVIDELNTGAQTSIDGGATNVLMPFLGLDDLTGNNDASLQVGWLNGALDPSHPGSWAANTLDWWYLGNANELDALGHPLTQLAPSSITGRVVTTGPADALAILSLGATVSNFLFRDLKLRAEVDAVPAPNTPAPPPGALAPGLAVFQSLTGDQPGQGICGALTVGSLATTPAPQEFTTGIGQCRAACQQSKTYTYCGQGAPVGPTCNSLLDVIVGGCRATALCINLVTPTQPDVGSNGNPPQVLSNGPINKVTVSQPNDGYSSYVRIKANRAHLTNNYP